MVICKLGIHHLINCHTFMYLKRIIVNKLPPYCDERR